MATKHTKQPRMTVEAIDAELAELHSSRCLDDDADRAAVAQWVYHLLSGHGSQVKKGGGR